MFRVVPLAALLALGLTGCGLPHPPGSAAAGTRLEVVAAENFWGSIAAQVGGSRVRVTSVLVNPDTDPHAYEPKPGDARAFAGARYVIVNGAGYDPWATKLLAANPADGRTELNVGAVVGTREGDNPHFWYSPDYVGRVIARIVADLQKLDPAGAAYFAEHGTAYRTIQLKDYYATVDAIKARYSGMPAGATESIFVYTAEATGLHLVTPPGYMKATSEGADPSAADKVAFGRQVSAREIRVMVFNSQNTSPEVNTMVARAKAQGIPVVAVTETLSPAGASFQDWQTAQLKSLLKALGG
ncbi:MAG: metal ABC transporter solute-binding protein, Zn/Mn family [Candidatus Dormibacteria bacterium]